MFTFVSVHADVIFFFFWYYILHYIAPETMLYSSIDDANCIHENDWRVQLKLNEYSGVLGHSRSKCGRRLTHQKNTIERNHTGMNSFKTITVTEKDFKVIIAYSKIQLEKKDFHEVNEDQIEKKNEKKIFTCTGREIDSIQRFKIFLAIINIKQPYAFVNI